MSHGGTHDEDDDDDETQLDRALADTEIDISERVPCRQLTYKTVTWAEEDINKKVPKELTSIDDMQIVGVCTGDRREKTTEKVKIIIPNADIDEVCVNCFLFHLYATPESVKVLIEQNRNLILTTSFETITL